MNEGVAVPHLLHRAVLCPLLSVTMSVPHLLHRAVEVCAAVQRAGVLSADVGDSLRVDARGVRQRERRRVEALWRNGG